MAEQTLESWLKQNKLVKIADKLAAADCESLEDLQEFENQGEIGSYAADMGLNALLTKKFVKAVMSLNDIASSQTQQPPQQAHQPQPVQPPQPLDQSQQSLNNKQPQRGAVTDDDEKNPDHQTEGVPEDQKKTEFRCSCHGQCNKGYHVVEKLRAIDPGRQNRTIMVIGATGTGKTTMLNSMMNYLWNVQYNDPLRYKLVVEKPKVNGQAESQTDNVTAYYLAPPKLQYQLTLIDSPGYGDTRGLEQDKKITQQIKKFFEQKIQSIDAICFVIRAPQARLTAVQKYIFAQVLGIFGNDIGENILVLLTFADGKKPPALEALAADKVPFKSSFKLNNSAFDLAESDDEDMFSKMFWQMGIKSFDNLFKSIGSLRAKSLQLTRKVLSRREELENYIVSVQPTIRAGFTALDKLRQQINVINKYGDLIDANKDFEYKVKKQKARQTPNNGAFNTTTCLTCNFTCHRSCAFSDNADKARCCAMGSDGKCRCCKGKCHWSLHKNVPYTVEWYEEEETETAQGLKDKYYDAKSKKSAQEQILAGLLADFEGSQAALNSLISNVRECLNELSKIALRPNVLTQDDYIDKLIQSEEAERKPGYKQRCAALRKLKEKQEMLAELNSDNYNPWKQYDDVREYVSKNENVKRNFNAKVSSKRQQGGQGFVARVQNAVSGWF